MQPMQVQLLAAAIFQCSAHGTIGSRAGQVVETNRDLTNRVVISEHEHDGCRQ